ncbi:MAG: SPFH domain-containing protein [Blautia sp.]|nr:SPFH domain-containing protein [Blautia sp.]
MGIIRAIGKAIGGGFSDQWLEVYEADAMSDQTVFARGVLMRKGQNKKGTEDTVSNGSIIHVYDNQFMLLVDGGKVVDYTAEPGYYKVDNSSMPSLFNGEFGETLQESFNRIKFGGQTPKAQKVFFINLQEIKGIKFGTRQPINYFDFFYNSELFLRAHGTYSIKIVNPLQFYAEAIPRNKDHVDITEINEQYLSEFLEALQSAINQMSAEGQRISFVTSKARELGKYMSSILDEDWNQTRGMEIQAVGIASLSYDEESQKLINMRNQGAMLSDPTVREGYVQGAMARGMEAAGSNANGAMAGFMGMGMGMNAMGNMAGATSATNLAQMQMQQGYPMGGAGQAMPQNPAMGGAGQAMPQNPAMGGATAAGGAGQPVQQPADGWTCECGTVNTGKFCSECGKPMPAGGWTCECGTVNTGKFCSECGRPRR